jgi:hypothetical protein
VQTLFRILKYNKNKDMNEKYYVVFDGTSAYIVGEEDIKEIETNKFAIEEIYGPSNFYVECQPSLNLSKSIYKKHEKTHNSPQKTTKKLINLVRKQKYYIFIMEQHVFNSCYGVGAKQARVQSLH